MTVGLVQKDFLLIIKTAWAGSRKTSPPAMASSEIPAGHGRNDRSRYSTNIDTLVHLKTYMPCARLQIGLIHLGAQANDMAKSSDIIHQFYMNLTDAVKQYQDNQTATTTTTTTSDDNIRRGF